MLNESEKISECARESTYLGYCGDTLYIGRQGEILLLLLLGGVDCTPGFLITVVLGENPGILPANLLVTGVNSHNSHILESGYPLTESRFRLTGSFGYDGLILDLNNWVLDLHDRV